MPIRPEDVRPEDERRVHENLDAKIEAIGRAGGVVGRLVNDARTLYELLRDPAFKMEWQEKAKIIACLLYFITPVDLVPDFILGFGFIDDAVVVGLTLKTLAALVERYRKFRASRESIPASARPVEIVAPARVLTSGTASPEPPSY